MNDPTDLTDLAWRVDPAVMGAHLSRLEAIEAGLVDEDDEWEDHRTQTSLTLYPHTTLLGRKFADAALGISRFQLWEAPPRYGKSLVASNWGPVWFEAMFPRKRFILGSYGDDLARRNGRIVRNLITAHSKRLGIDISTDSKAQDRFATSAGGSLLAAGVGSAMTGFGADGMVIDDPIKNWQEAQSATIRDNVWDWFRSVAFTRLHKGGFIIVCATRWHRDDLTGRLKAEDRRRVQEGKPPMWEVVRLPTIADAESRGETDPIGRSDGEVLCPDLFPMSEVAIQRETMSPPLFRAMHQQDPADAEGTIFKRDWFRFYESMPPPEQIQNFVLSCDMAFKDRFDSSYVVLQVWARVDSDHFLVDERRGRWDYPSTRSEVVRLWNRWDGYGRRRVTMVLVEDKANGPAIISELGQAIDGMVPVTPQGSKESRAQAVAGIPYSGHVFLPAPSLQPWVNDWLDEVCGFPDDVNDDRVDAFSQYLLRGGGVLSTSKGTYGRAPSRR